MTELLEQSEALKASISTNFKRYLFDEIDWSNRLIGIKGARGTGKTTLLLQRLKELALNATHAAYFSLDDIYFLEHSLVGTIRQYHKEGGRFVFLDEVHKYPNWSREVKNLYDQIPDLSIVFTGSSIIDISRQESDLSRRVLMHELPGLSYREFLALNGIINIPSITVSELIDSKRDIRELFPGNFKPYEHFNNYLNYGYYPFYSEDIIGYKRRLRQMVRIIVEYDMAELKGFDIRNARKMLQLLQIIAQQVPFKPNLVKLAEKSGIHRNTILNYLHFLEEARLIKLLYPSGNSIAKLQKPEKLYLDNTNLLISLSNENNSVGTVRETFFYNQLNIKHNVYEPKQGDFDIDGQIIFEVGGRNKKQKQIKGLTKAFIVKDELEYPIDNAIPLWLFGFTY